jgi:hypothetical protein
MPAAPALHSRRPLIAAAPGLVLWRAAAMYRYRPKRVYDRGFLADALGISNVPHEARGEDQTGEEGDQP